MLSIGIVYGESISQHMTLQTKGRITIELLIIVITIYIVTMKGNKVLKVKLPFNYKKKVRIGS